MDLGPGEVIILTWLVEGCTLLPSTPLRFACLTWSFSIHFFRNMAYHFIKKTVDEFQQPNTATANKHYHDLKTTSLKLYNEICGSLKNGTFGGLKWVDVVLEASDVIEETTLMREQMKVDVQTYERDIINYYLHDHDTFMMPHAIGTVNKGRSNERKLTVKQALRKFRDARDTKPKSWAIEVVTKMYRLDCINRQDMRVDDDGVYHNCGDDELTADINAAFSAYTRGLIDGKAYQLAVCEAYDAYKGRGRGFK